MDRLLVGSVPVIVVSANRCRGSVFSSAAVLEYYIPENPKYVVVPQGELDAYRAILRNNHSSWTVVSEPSAGLAAADEFLSSHHFPLSPPMSFHAMPFERCSRMVVINNVICNIENHQDDFRFT